VGGRCGFDWDYIAETEGLHFSSSDGCGRIRACEGTVGGGYFSLPTLRAVRLVRGGRVGLLGEDLKRRSAIPYTQALAGPTALASSGRDEQQSSCRRPS